jgi:hypothetical protein
MKNLWILVLSLSACGAPLEADELGTLEQASSSSDAYGWRADATSGWEHQRCNSGTVGQVCMIPRPRPGFESPITANTYVRSINDDSFESAFPAGWDVFSEAQAVEGYFVVNGPFAFTWGTPLGGTDLTMLNDAAVYSGVLPPTDIFVSNVMQIACWASTQINQGTNADYAQCNQIVAKVDVSAIVAWANAAGMSNTQRDRVLRQLYAHAMGAVQGLGANPDLAAASLMNRKIKRTPPDVGLSAFEKCLLQSFEFSAPLADLNVAFGWCN